MLFRSDLSGANVEDVHVFATQANWFKSLCVDPRAGGKIYWWNGSDRKIYACDKDGSNASVLVTASSTYFDIAAVNMTLDLVNDRIVWTNGSLARNKVYYIPLTGGTETAIVTITTTTGWAPGKFAVNPATGKMYWAAYFNDDNDGDFRMADYPSGANMYIIDGNEAGSGRPAEQIACDPVADRIWFIHVTKTGSTLKYANGSDGSGVTATTHTGYWGAIAVYNE